MKICLNPIKMVKDKQKNAWFNPWTSPKTVKTFSKKFNAPQQYKNYSYNWVGCQNCYICKYKKINEWSLRVSKEIKQYDHNYFITLTYNEQKVKKIMSPDKNGELKPYTQLVYRDFQLFLKKLRKHLNYYKLLPKGQKLKYILTSEYGKKHGRIHFHVIFINLPLQDIHWWNKTKEIYKSPTINHIWGNGYVDIRKANHDTINYCLKYLAKDSFHGEQGEILKSKWYKRRKYKKAICWLLNQQKHQTQKQILKNKKYAYKIIKQKIKYQEPNNFKKQQAERLEAKVNNIDIYYPKKPIFTQSKGIGLTYFIENMDAILQQGFIWITNGKGKKIQLGIPRYFRKKLNELFPEKYELLMEQLEQSLIKLHTEIKQELNKYKKTYEDLINYSSRQVHKYFNKVIPLPKKSLWKIPYELDRETIKKELIYDIKNDIIII